MKFEEDLLYHIYNQGNNRHFFFVRENYLFFLRKVRTQLLPYCDILAYCLMPNHFHFMVKVNKVELSNDAITIGSATGSRAPNGNSIQKSIGILLASYTRAINKQEQTTGSLFRQKTKAECLNSVDGVTPSFFNTKSGTLINIDHPAKQYQQVCFNYIHNNPVKAGLTSTPIDWEFSSAKEYAGLRNGSLVNTSLAKKYVQT